MPVVTKHPGQLRCSHDLVAVGEITKYVLTREKSNCFRGRDVQRTEEAGRVMCPLLVEVIDQVLPRLWILSGKTEERIRHNRSYR